MMKKLPLIAVCAIAMLEASPSRAQQATEVAAADLLGLKNLGLVV